MMRNGIPRTGYFRGMSISLRNVTNVDPKAGARPARSGAVMMILFASLPGLR